MGDDEARLSARGNGHLTLMPGDPDYEFSGYNISDGKDGKIVGDSDAMRKVFNLLDNITHSPNQDFSVLIMGETGTGKELVARAIHYNSEKRRKRPYKGISIAALSTTLLEAALFGHKRGAFTDAKTDGKGFFEAVDGGTLFLDEIESLGLEAQIKLLRALEENEFYRVGDSDARIFQGRVVAGTKQDLRKLITKSRFRNDLFHRLNEVTVRIPPLRERSRDISLLFSYFVHCYNAKYGTNYDIHPSAAGDAALNQYTFPGNVRELEKLVTRAIVHFPDSRYVRVEEIFANEAAYDSLELSARDLFLRQALTKSRFNGLKPADKVKVMQVLEAYFDTNANISKYTARIGISYQTFYHRLRRAGIDRENLKALYQTHCLDST